MIIIFITDLSTCSINSHIDVKHVQCLLKRFYRLFYPDAWRLYFIINWFSQNNESSLRSPLSSLANFLIDLCLIHIEYLYIIRTYPITNLGFGIDWHRYELLIWNRYLVLLGMYSVTVDRTKMKTPYTNRNYINAKTKDWYLTYQ